MYDLKVGIYNINNEYLFGIDLEFPRIEPEFANDNEVKTYTGNSKIPKGRTEIVKSEDRHKTMANKWNERQTYTCRTHNTSSIVCLNMWDCEAKYKPTASDQQCHISLILLA